MSDRTSQETPRPPETAEFGHVVPGGSGARVPAGGRRAARHEAVGRAVRQQRVRRVRRRRGPDRRRRRRAGPHPRAGEGAPRGRHRADARPSGPRAGPAGARRGARLPRPRASRGPLARSRSSHSATATTIVGGRLRGPRRAHAGPHAGKHVLHGRAVPVQRRHAVPGRPRQHGRRPRAVRPRHGEPRRLFATLPDETRICPGHGLDSTIGRERPDVEAWRARGW